MPASSWGWEADESSTCAQARQLALRFDAAPGYGLEHHKFITLQRDAAAYDDFGPTALEGVGATKLKDNEKRLPRPVGPVGGGLP